MKTLICSLLLASLALCAAPRAAAASSPSAPDSPTTAAAAAGFAGSKSCKECHPKFYDLWSTSFHGLAMQPYSARFASEKLTTQTQAIKIKDVSYLAQTGPGQGWVSEKTPAGETNYPILHVMGGKNVYYFLTLLDKGRLQTLPVAYDVRQKQWFDTAASGVRHIPGQSDSPVHWKEWPYTFNTACYGCHVSQLSTNYDAASDTYRTTWLEPGINCETCHGPSAAHNQAFSQAPKDKPPKDLKLISARHLSTEQNNASCASCHAKVSPLSSGFVPGASFWDHFDLLTLEHPDYYPDGRDLGENYTQTSWMMSPCARSGKLSCLHCHTSSGRYRFHGAQANQACMPCHAKHVENPSAHTRHAPTSPASKCISCHMPMTSFARMNRSDHSMRPPMPSATQAFGSPNACNLCHKDKDAAWADRHVRQWRARDYQTTTVEWARLVDEARKQKWERLEAMLAYVQSPARDEIAANSLVRLLRQCPDARKQPVLAALLKDTSPLIRSSAAEQLGDMLTAETAASTPLLDALRDASRLVRIRAASALAPVPADLLPSQYRDDAQRAFGELEQALRARPDDAASHYNLGNYFASKGRHRDALACFETSMRLRPDFVMPMVNASLTYNALGDNAKAEKSLRRALDLEPNSVAAQLNLAMLLAEMSRMDEAKAAFEAALRADPNCAAAAYNLGVIAGQAGRLAEAADYCRKAAQFGPADPKYAYTHAFYLTRAGKIAEADQALRALIEKHPRHADAYLLLSDLQARQGQLMQAQDTLRQALSAQSFPAHERRSLEAQLYQLQPQ